MSSAVGVIGFAALTGVVLVALMVALAKDLRRSDPGATTSPLCDRGDPMPPLPTVFDWTRFEVGFQEHIAAQGNGVPGNVRRRKS